MKKYLLFCYALLIAPFPSLPANAQSGTQFYGVVADSFINNMRLSKINCNPPDYSLISPSTLGNFIFSGSQAAIDPARKWYFTFDRDSLSNIRLFTIDINTGQTLFDPLFIDSGIYIIDSFLAGFYYCNADTTLYGIRWKESKTSLVKIDFRTGDLEHVTSLSLVGFSFGATLVSDQSESYFYVEGHTVNGQNRLLKINRTTGYVEQSFALDNDGKGTGYFLATTCNSDQLYALRIRANGAYHAGTCYLVKINPADGSQTTLINESLDDFVRTMPLIDDQTNTLYFFGSMQNVGMRAHAINLNSLNNTNIPFNGIPPYSMAKIPDYSVKAEFSYDKTCYGAPTSFYNLSTGVSFNWNFDDPASVHSNFSSELNPLHQFAAPGEYNIQLIVSNCFYSDTIIKTITIEEFPNVFLGNDTTICSNNPFGMNLTADYPGYQVQWQDGSAKNTYFIDKSGEYILTVAGACGSVSDTLKVDAVYCPCEINLYPNLTLRNVQLDLGCDISNFHHLILSVFDMIGRKIYESPEITSSSTLFQFQNWAAACYLYKVTDDGNSISAGKFVMMK